MPVNKVLVVGGGITGSVLCLALAQRGVEVELAEVSPQWFGVGHGITIQGNALKALRSVGVLDRVLARAVPFDLMRLRRADGGLITELETPHTGGADLPSTAGALRSDLQNALCDAVYAHGVTVRLGLSVRTLDQAAGHVDVDFTDGTAGRYDLVVGADGINSAMRALIGITTRPRPVGMSIFRVVARRPAEMDCAEVYYGGPRYKAGYSPISDDQCYAYLLDENLDASLIGPRASLDLLRERGAGYGGTWGKILASLPDDTAVDYRWIEAVLVDEDWHRGRAMVIGDAAHACPPLIAQGAAMCMEDAVLLAELVTADEPVDRALARFMARRLPRVRMVLDNSLQLADWEIHPDTPGADPARIMSETLASLTVAA
ncbi:FAD-dependent monooxygenase [Streptomyces fuscichromogenes]|uniref:FAD-dependent oxidoreductase n=1 Tax=Streptomyces fuscichromogenes TaxID=1324013 RepID=A0A918CRD9_9ACTN|nr:FAD-dependent monooxygenase [Streptomyces fuscichromogenes]GGN09858.1 FAD-dependent oxidoreductase [Streptomyces fuscichromogenes]